MNTICTQESMELGRTDVKYRQRWNGRFGKGTGARSLRCSEVPIPEVRRRLLGPNLTYQREDEANNRVRVTRIRQELHGDHTLRQELYEPILEVFCGLGL